MEGRQKTVRRMDVGGEEEEQKERVELTYLQNLVQVLLAALHPKLMVIGETPITH